MEQQLTDIEAVIRAYLPQILHMSLGTTDGLRPWVCEVHFSYDNDLNLYFRSTPSRRHSQHIAKNANVAGNIVVQHTAQDKPRGVYFEGQAVLLTDVDEQHLAYKVVTERHNLGPEILDLAAPDNGIKFYKITVTDYYVFDVRESKPPRKYHWQPAR